MAALDYSKWDALVDSEDEEEGQPQQPQPQQHQAQTPVPQGLPPDARLVDPSNLPPELASDPALMRQLKAAQQQQQRQGHTAAPAAAAAAAGGAAGGGSTGTQGQRLTQTPHGSETGRHAFEHNGHKVYEWEQNLTEVNIWVRPPPGVTKHDLDITIAHQHLAVGLKGNPPFLNEATGGDVIVQESFWSLQDGELNINLQKMRKAEMWASALRGHGRLDPLTHQEDQKRLMLERFQEENPGFDFSNADFNGQIPNAREFMGGVRY